MTTLLYISLCIALASLGLFYALNDSSNSKRWLAVGSGVSYALFIVIALVIQFEQKAAIKPVPQAIKEKFAKVATASTEVKQPAVVKASNLSVKVRTVQSALEPNKNVTLQILVVNKWDQEVPDLRMKFLSGQLRWHFEVLQIKANSNIYIFSDLITLGTLKSGESRMLEFELLPRSPLPYKGKIVWQAGNTYIVNEENKPLNSLIEVAAGEDSVQAEDSDFEHFVDLRPINDFDEAPIEKPEDETYDNGNEPEQEQNQEPNEDIDQGLLVEDELYNETEDEAENQVVDQPSEDTVTDNVY